MTDEEMAEEYVDTLLNKDDSELDKFLDENLGDLELNKKQAGTLLGIIKGVGICSYLAGLKAGRPEWHKVADGDLPKENHIVLVLNKQTGYEIARHAPFEEYLLDNWVTIDNRCFTQAKNNPIIIAWCEIPKYTEESDNEKA